MWPDISCSHICVVSLFLRLRVWTMAPCGRTQTSPRRTAPSITRSLPPCGLTSHAPISVLSLSVVQAACLDDGSLWEDPDIPAEDSSIYYKDLPPCGLTSHAPISVLSLCSSGCVSGRWLSVGGPRLPCGGQLHLLQGPPSVWPDISCSHICVVSLFLRLRVWTMARCGRTQTSPRRTAPSITRNLPPCGLTSHAPISVLSLCSSGCVSGRWLPVGGHRLPRGGQLHLL